MAREAGCTTDGESISEWAAFLLQDSINASSMSM